MKNSKLGKIKIDLSKLYAKKMNELEWVIIIEKIIKRPKELGENIIIKKTIKFTYYKDKLGCYWLNTCGVPSEYQEQGIGKMMIKRAVKEYGQVYFSNATRIQFNLEYPEHGYDSRYLTSEGKKLVNALIRDKDIPSDWSRFPEL